MLNLIIEYVHYHKNKFNRGEKLEMGWYNRRRWTGPWPGRGPFSDLPPWERPGWMYGRGACWRFYGPYAVPLTPIKPDEERSLLAEEKAFLEGQLETVQKDLEKIQQRLAELEK